MTINELYIQLDLQPENRIDILKDTILKDTAIKCDKGYLFVDSSDGHCYLFDRNGNEDDVKKLKKIDNQMFFGSNIKSIIIPDSVKSIGYDAFGHCESLKSVVIPDSVRSIGHGAFYKCESLTSIIIPDLVESIEYYAFAWCESLKSIIIPDSVESIGNWAFYGCKKLKSIVISNSVKIIGDYDFWGCKSLKSVVFKGKTIDQVKKMANYPFGIKDKSIIKCI